MLLFYIILCFLFDLKRFEFHVFIFFSDKIIKIVNGT